MNQMNNYNGIFERNSRLHRLLSLIVIVAALFGTWQTMTITDPPSLRMLLYFTIQSNLWIAGIHLYFLFAEAAEQRYPAYQIRNGMRVLKYVLTVSITLTFIIFFAVLLPVLGISAIRLPGSMATHFVAPLAAISDFLLFEDKLTVQKHTVFTSLLPPLFYVSLTLILSLSGVTYSDGSSAPYFFLDYRQLGWLRIAADGIGIVYWIILLGLLVLGIGWLFLKLNARLQKDLRPDADKPL